MFAGDDEEDDDGGIGTSRYPCMPSLLALQQMKNRLHLARLGKKLMKWTALATGREMRRIALELHRSYKSFREDVGNAFMLLARSRYFYPNLNMMVLENTARQAMLNVFRATTTITGVKVLQFDVRETGIEPYEHLGLEKGGETILEAKVVWQNLLKLLILMVQLRTSFRQVEAAHKTASNRKEVLNRIIIPRIKATIKYIFTELEELEREELYRVKKVQVNKMKILLKKKLHEQEHISQISAETDIERQESVKLSDQALVRKSIVEEFEDKLLLSELTLTVKQTTKSQTKLPSSIKPKDCRDACMETQLEFLKKQLNKMTILSEKLISSNFANIDVNDYLKVCENIKFTIDRFFIAQRQPADDQLKKRLYNLKYHLKEIIDGASKFTDKSPLSPNTEHFLRTCENIATKLDVCLNKLNSGSVKDDVKNRLNDLKSHIDSVLSRTEEYRKKDLLTPSIEEFMTSCNTVKLKIEGYINKTDNEKQMLNNLNEYIEDIEQFVDGVHQDEIASLNLENFITSEKNLGAKIEECERTEENLSTECNLGKLINHIDDAIELSRSAEESSEISATAQDFIKFYEDIKIKIKEKTSAAELPDILLDLRQNLDKLISLVSKRKEQRILTPSIENCIKSCEKAKANLDLLERLPSKSSTEAKILYPIYNGTYKSDTSKVILDGLNLMQEGANTNVLLLSPCNSYKDVEKQNNSKEFLCKSCDQNSLRGESEQECVSLEQYQEYPCDTCQKYSVEDIQDPEGQFYEEKKVVKRKKEQLETTDSTFSYFEKTVRKITRVKRTRNLDGTILEEKETILITKEKYDPTKTSVVEDCSDRDNLSYESVLGETSNDRKDVGLCITKDLNQRGFMTKLTHAQSELIKKPSKMIASSLRHCLSEHTVLRKNVASLETLSVFSSQSNQSS